MEVEDKDVFDYDDEVRKQQPTHPFFPLMIENVDLRWMCASLVVFIGDVGPSHRQIYFAEAITKLCVDGLV